MNRFVKYSLVFLTPLITLFIALEIMVTRIPNTYAYKYDYVKNHGDSIEVIAIGHSQLYDGFMAEAFSKPAFNLSNSAQMHRENYYVMKELLPSMNRLKTVIMPLGYIDVEAETEKNHFNDYSCYYHKYMKLNYDGRLPLKYWYECFSPHRAYEKAALYYIHKGEILSCDSFGRESKRNLEDRDQPLGFSNHHFLRDYTAEESEQYYIKDSEFLIKNIEMLTDRSIDVVLVSPPHFWGDFKPNQKQLDFLHNYIGELQRKYRFRYIDMQFDKEFVDRDYYNETHLSQYGAEKFTKKIDAMLNSDKHIL